MSTELDPAAVPGRPGFSRVHYFALGAWLLAAAFVAAGHINAHSGQYSKTFIEIIRIVRPLLAVFASAMIFSSPRLHQVRYRKGELFGPWLLWLFLLVVAFAVPVAISSYIGLQRQLAYVAQAPPPNLFVSQVYGPFMQNLPYVFLGMAIGTLARQNWLALIGGLILSPLFIYLFVMLPQALAAARLWPAIQSGPTRAGLYMLLVYSLIAPIVPLLLFALSWRFALWGGEKDRLHRGARSLTSVMMRKEFQLQKNNLLVTLGTLLLSVLGVAATYVFDFSATGFDSAGVRSAFISCLTVPMLVFILPAMIGSTAAAAERAMDVWRWQCSLPVTWRRVILVKALVMALLIFGISGILPYLTHPVSEVPSTVFWMFRNAWTFWSALLCCAIGFFAGSLSRDDYQGLMVSVGVLVYFVLFSFLGDPEGLVFPAYLGKTFAYRSDFWLILRLGIVAVLLLWAGGQFLRRDGVNWKRHLALFASVMAPVIFLLTLFHLRQDRVLFTYNSTLAVPTYMSDETTGTCLLIPKYMASAELDQHGRYAHIDSSLYNRFAQSNNTLGTISKDRDRAYLYKVSNAGLAQFYQTMYVLRGESSPDGRWALLRDVTDHYALCGPGGININTRLFPDGLVRRAAEIVGISSRRIEKTRSADELAAASNDLLLDKGEWGPVIWKNGQDYVAPEHGKDVVKLGPDFVSHTLQLQADNLSNGISAVFTDKQSSRTVWMGLRYERERETGIAKLSSFAFDKVERNNVFYRPNPDSPWFAGNKIDSTKRLLAKPGKGFTINKAAQPPEYWEIDQAIPQDDGTTVSLHPLAQIARRGDSEYAFYLYARELSVQLTNRPPVPIVINYGIMVFDLATGEKQYVILDEPAYTPDDFLSRYLPLYDTETMRNQLGRLSKSAPHYFIGKDGTVVSGPKDGALTILQPTGPTWDKATLKRYTSGIPGMSGMRFVTDNKLELISENSDLYTLTIPPPAP